MTNLKSTRRALFTSVIAFVLCFSMLLGTTYAWFTDSVTSTGNIIKTGTLDITLEYKDTFDGDWKDASTGAIFDYENWEPGYTQVKYVRIANVGSLALQFMLNIVPNDKPEEGEVNLADVIDVYMINEAVEVDSIDDLTTDAYVGTLTSIMNDADGAARGVLAPASDTNKGELVVAIALHMQEEAGNEYQNLSVGGGFTLQLLATQLGNDTIAESDSFDNTYDEDAEFDFIPVAAVTKQPAKTVTATLGIGGAAEEMNLNTAFQFEPTESYEEAQASEYRYWHADFVVHADKDVPANSMALAGYYDAWCQYNNDNWVALMSDTDIAANTEIRLVELLGATVNYEELCNYGNDGIGFLCGAADLTGENVGTTLTVELRLYETKDAADTTNNTTNEETGEYVTIGIITYRFPGTEVKNDAELAAAIANGDTVIDLADGTYYIPNEAQGKTLTLTGSENAVIKLKNEGEDGCDYSFGAPGAGIGNITFNGVTIDTTENNGNYKGYAYMKGTFNNCNFVGAYSLNNANDFVFNNCTFDFKNGYFWTWGANSVIFDGCTFNGNSKAILAHGSASTEITINNCDFAATEQGFTGSGDNTAAVEIDPVGTNTYTINFTGENTITDSYAGWTRVKDDSTGHTITGVN